MARKGVRDRWQATFVGGVPSNQPAGRLVAHDKHAQGRATWARRWAERRACGGQVLWATFLNQVGRTSGFCFEPSVTVKRVCSGWLRRLPVVVDTLYLYTWPTDINENRGLSFKCRRPH
ncbi:hypothetical protein BCR44DRAFT_1441864 [Catenaria anguillulae PL171]|uniref:Uncharacterized protein n=1 Tax=Catenaria anguillulae PL171 TaxID=765915 RepID=A0A1Y2HCH0_9FUNG|nr:hypothetical protein BCR44DRAFT_1441864 [Catenaria anguillulae PL171]